jgi:hypothetical protein
MFIFYGKNTEKIGDIMKNREVISKEKRKKMPSHMLRKKNDEMMANGMVDYLCLELGATIASLAAMINVTEKTLASWRNESVSELEENKKSLRLITLYNFVNLAREFKMDKYLILSMLHEPVDPMETQSGSILSHLIKDPSSDLFKVMAPKFIREYLLNQDLKRRVLTLSNKDRDTFLAAIENPPKANSALKELFNSVESKSTKK